MIRYGLRSFNDQWRLECLERLEIISRLELLGKLAALGVLSEIVWLLALDRLACLTVLDRQERLAALLGLDIPSAPVYPLRSLHPARPFLPAYPFCTVFTVRPA